jgi:hypothetical protein
VLEVYLAETIAARSWWGTRYVMGMTCRGGEHDWHRGCFTGRGTLHSSNNLRRATMKKIAIAQIAAAAVELDLTALAATEGGMPGSLSHKPGYRDLRTESNSKGTQTESTSSYTSTGTSTGSSSRDTGTQTTGRFVSAPPSYTSGSGHSSPGGGPADGFRGYEPGRWS